MLEPASLLCQRVRRAWLGHAKYRVSPSRWPDYLHDGGTVYMADFPWPPTYLGKDLHHFVVEPFASVSATVCSLPPRKCVARFCASRASILAPAIAFCACWACSSRGPDRVISAAANSICGSSPRSAMAFLTMA